MGVNDIRGHLLLKLQVVVSHLTCVLATKLQSSVKRSSPLSPLSRFM